MSNPGTRIAIVASGAALIAASAGALALVIASAQGYVNLAWTAAAVLALTFLSAALIRRIRIATHPVVPWVVGLVSLLANLLPWWLLTSGQTQSAALIYQGLKVPQGIIRFWDLSLVLESVDCARWGFDIYAVGNGCLADPSIYAPGMVWLQYVPGEIFSKANAGWLGVVMIIISSLALLMLARWSTGVGHVVLLIAAVGAPWMLLLERGNVDAVVIWVAVITVALAYRWNSTATWTIAAILIWLVGTWKYYPFALGLLMLPALAIRRGWMIIVGFLVATFGYLVFTWEGLRTSSAASSAMVDFGDFVVLGRIPVVARMAGHAEGIGTWQVGDLLMIVIGLLAVALGFLVAWRNRLQAPLMGALATAGGVVYLTVVLIAGFGYGYKATFLLLAVPLLANWPAAKSKAMVAVGIAAVLLIGIESVVVWNTVLVTLAGVIAAGLATGAGASVMLRSDLGSLSSRLVSTRSPD